MKEITAIYIRERLRFENSDGDTIIGDVRLANGSGQVFCDSLPTAVKGKADVDELQPHQTYRFYGRGWSDYRNKRSGQTEHQFDFQTFIRSQPHGRAGVISYLKQAGRGHGIGQARATTLWEKFGSDAVRILREDPEIAAAACVGLSVESAKDAAAWLKDEHALEGCTIDLIDLLDGKGFPKDVARKAVKLWGNRAADMIKRDPYRLMSFRGCGFKRADALWMELGLPAAKLRRQALCAWYAVASNTDGHTWLPAETCVQGLRDQIGGADLRPVAAIKMALRLGRVSVDRQGALATIHSDATSKAIVDRGGLLWVAEGRKAWSEQRLAELVVGSFTEVVQWPSVETIDGIDEHQRIELAKALRGTVGILGGSPGTGKTWTGARLIGACVAAIGAQHIGIGCPTGKAAVRMTETLAGYGLPLRARTWHSLLGVGQTDEEAGTWGFTHHEGKPWEYRVLIGDECFPAGTQVDTPCGPVAIERIKPGDKILNAIGTDYVVAVKRKEVSRGVKIRVGEAVVTTSESHPFFTERGVVVASELKCGDSLLTTTEAMRLLRRDDQAEVGRERTETFLQSILLNEMVATVPGIPSEIEYRRAEKEGRRGTGAFFTERIARSRKADSTDTRTESDGERINSAKGINEAEGYRTQAVYTGRKRQTCSSGTGRTASRVGDGLAYGVCDSNEFGDVRISHALQIGYRKSSVKDCNRSRWQFAPVTEKQESGWIEGFISRFARVDSVEVLEQGCFELDRLRDADGKLYFYDIQAARHRSFSVCGLLVHNCSMLDTNLLCSIFRARSAGTLFLLVGDVHQLPPVGHGAPLRDLIAAGLPYGELREIKRNSGGIVEACAAIRDGKRWGVGDNLQIKDGATEPERQIAATLAAIDVARQEGLNPVWDCQVVVAVNAKSKLSRKDVNKVLQAELNKSPAIPGCWCRTGDKIVNLKNGHFTLVEKSNDDEELQVNERGECYVANGELAEVIEVGEKSITARLTNPMRMVRIPRGRQEVSSQDQDVKDESDDKTSTGCSWDLGYALSCHKCQGSEWPVVVVLIDEYPGARRICDRSWLYTAISRAKQRCVIIGKKATADRFCRQVAIGKRKTFLRELIALKTAERTLVEL